MNAFQQILQRLGQQLRELLHSRQQAADVAGPSREDRFESGDFEHARRQVGYRLFVPGTAPARGAPLLMMLHGCTQDAEDFAAGTRMNEAARRAGVLVLYPTQTRLHNPGKCWNWFMRSHQTRERGECALLHALLREVAGAEGVDPTRLYVAGLSAGGAMASLLAANYPDTFAAAAIHSGLRAQAAGDLHAALQAMQQGAAPADVPMQVPTMVFQGDQDATVHPLNAQRIVESLALGHAGWHALPPDRGTSAGGKAWTRTRYADGNGRVQAESWTVHGLAHAWSGGSPAGSHTDASGPDATGEILRFCLSHTLEATAEAERAAA